MGSWLIGLVVVVAFAWAALVGYGLAVSVIGRLRDARHAKPDNLTT